MVAELTDVGVPEIAPVDVENASPAGSDGEIDQPVTVPPLEDGIAVVIAVPFDRVNGLPLYTMSNGAASLIVMVTDAVALPPVLLAYTVYVVEDDRVVGVPDISPFEVEKARPDGSVGVISHEVTVPPNADGVAVVIVVPFVSVNGLPLYDTEYGERSLTWMVTVAVPLPPAFVAVIT